MPGLFNRLLNRRGRRLTRPDLEFAALDAYIGKRVQYKPGKGHHVQHTGALAIDAFAASVTREAYAMKPDNDAEGE